MDNQTDNKEKVYDEKIAHLVDQIIAICQENGIGMAMTFSIPSPEAGDMSCSTCLTSVGYTSNPLLRRVASLIYGKALESEIVSGSVVDKDGETIFRIPKN